VGRAGQLAALRAAFSAAESGVRQVVLVSGEPGIGKTALIDAFLAGLPPAAAGLVAVGQCHPVGAGEPYAPVLDALFELAKGPAARAVRRHLDELAPGWLLQLPALVDASHAASLATRTLGSTPERMLREALGLLDTLATIDGGPLVLVLEDLHWADRGTIDLLTALARRRGPAPMLLTCTYRHNDLHPGDILPGAVAELVVRGLATDLRLGPLSLDAVSELVSPGHRTAETMVQLHRRSGGNPLFLTALLDAEAGTAPRSLREIVERHLDRLAPADRDLIEAAAVAGIEFDARVLDADAESAAYRCATLAARDHVIAVDDRRRPGRYRFRHAVYQEVTYALMAPARLRALHQAVGVRLETGAGDPAAAAAELAEHFTRSGDALRAVRYRLEAAELAAARGAPATALSHLESGRALLPLLPDGDQRRRLEADLLTSSAFMAVSVHGFAVAGADESLERARGLYLDVGDVAAAHSVAYGLAGLHEYRGEFDRSQALMEQRLRTAASDDPTVVGLHDIIACSRLHLGAFADALRHAEAALAHYDPKRDLTVLAMVGENTFVTSQHWTAFALWFTGWADRALQHSAAAVEFARRPGHAFCLCLALEQAATLHQLRREPDRVRDLAEEMLALAAEGGLPYREATAGVLLGWARGALGAADEGSRQLDAALDAYRRTGAAIELPYFLILQADAARNAGRFETCERALAEARQLARARPSHMEPEIERLTAAMLHARGADPSSAEAHLRAAIAVARDRAAPALELRAATDLRRLQIATGRPDDADSILRSAVDQLAERADTPDLRDAVELQTR
jgi:hypothetical protein